MALRAAFWRNFSEAAAARRPVLGGSGVSCQTYFFCSGSNFKEAELMQ